MREKLEFQADRIETVLSVHKVPARVTGGTVTPRWIRFQVLPAVGAKISKIKRLSEEMAAALNASNCRVSRDGASMSIEVPRDDPQPVRLLPLFRQLADDAPSIASGPGGAIPPATAVLGLAEDGAPLLIRLPSPDVAHILVAGTTGSGKTVLLQTMILSLAMANPAPALFRGNGLGGGVALVLVDPKGHAFGAFESAANSRLGSGPGLPHLARPVVKEVEEATEALNSLVRLMEKRGPVGNRSENGRQGEGPSHIVVVIDELADLVMTGGKEVQRALTRLTQRGREVGIHIIAATQKPTTAVLGSLIKANFPVRIVGRVVSANDARTATGWSGTEAERLTGRGDFLAVAEGRLIRFQGAHVSPEEIQKTVALLTSNGANGGSSTISPDASSMHLPALLQPVNRLAEAFGGGMRG